jgi:hypothetical protein
MNAKDANKLATEARAMGVSNFKDLLKIRKEIKKKSKNGVTHITDVFRGTNCMTNAKGLSDIVEILRKDGYTVTHMFDNFYNICW